MVPYNDTNAVNDIFLKFGNEIACVIVEPLAGNMGLIKPNVSFLENLREITTKYNSVLIFDEVITGFRLCYGGFQNIVKIKPDLTTLGKIIGGGLPIGAVGGKKEIMNLLAPLGSVYQAGTLSGNPVALAAGVQSLKLLKDQNVYIKLEENTVELADQIKNHLTQKGYCMQNIGSMFCIYFQKEIPTNLMEMKRCNIKSFNLFFHKLLENGIYFSPSQFETNFLSLSHNKEIVKEAANKIIKSIA